MINYYKDYGNIYIINLDKNRSGLEIIEVLKDFKGKSLVLNGKDAWYVILYDTFNRHAYDKYYELHGKSIHKLETLTGGILLSVIEDIIRTS